MIFFLLKSHPCVPLRTIPLYQLLSATVWQGQINILRKTLHLSVKNTPIHSRHPSHHAAHSDAPVGQGVELVTVGASTDLTGSDGGGRAGATR